MGESITRFQLEESNHEYGNRDTEDFAENIEVVNRIR